MSISAIKQRTLPLNTSTEVQRQDMRALCDAIHASNVAAGWWSELQPHRTPIDRLLRRPGTRRSILKTRNRGELLMLIVSEVSEADYGRMVNAKDDKLPHLPMYQVELADAAIRLFDAIGAERSIEHDPFSFVGFAARIDRLKRDPEVTLLTVVNACSTAMEGHRKGLTQTYRDWLEEALALVFALAEKDKIPLLDIIETKRAFNANRADHKLENRVKDGGKQY